jgi:hypothetical protein
MAPSNGAVHITRVNIKHVMSSAAEAALWAPFYIAQDAFSIRVSFEELGHPQPPTVIQMDNECAKGIANERIKQRRSKAMDMRFYWIQSFPSARVRLKGLTDILKLMKSDVVMISVKLGNTNFQIINSCCLQ